MPVDFSLLPPLEPVPSKSPSRFVWTVVFFVLTSLGIFGVLFLWPKGEPTQTPWFWTCITVYPLGIATFVVLRRYSVYEGRRLDAIAWNDARDRYVREVFDAASRPLAVLGSAYRFSTVAEENNGEQLRSGAIVLKTREPLARNAEPLKARWLSLSVVKFDAGNDRDDLTRQSVLLKWIFDDLLDGLAAVIYSLPSALTLTVDLAVSGLVPREDVESTWKSAWQLRQFRATALTSDSDIADLMRLDDWLDEAGKSCREGGQLMVCVQLNRVFDEVPLVGSSEAGVALLVAPLALAKRNGVSPIAHLHRPMQGQTGSIDHLLEHALKWADAKAADVVRTWQTGLDITQSGLLKTSLVKAKMESSVSDLDKSIGYAGEVAPWLAVACAVEAAKSEARAQLIAIGKSDDVQLAVIAVPD